MTQTTQMSITRALTSLKAVKKELADYFENPRTFIIALQGTNEAVVASGMTKASLETVMQSDYDGYTGRINRLHALKSAIIKSNAVTTVTINGKQYTVAEAIELKATLPFKEVLLAHFKKQWVNVSRAVNENNNKVNELFAKNTNDLKATVNEQTAESTKNYLDTMQKLNDKKFIAKVYDYLKLETKIKELSDEIAAIKLELDYVLSESNTTTLIEVEL